MKFSDVLRSSLGFDLQDEIPKERDQDNAVKGKTT